MDTVKPTGLRGKMHLDRIFAEIIQVMAKVSLLICPSRQSQYTQSRPM